MIPESTIPVVRTQMIGQATILCFAALLPIHVTFVLGQDDTDVERAIESNAVARLAERQWSLQWNRTDDGLEISHASFIDAGDVSSVDLTSLQRFQHLQYLAVDSPVIDESTLRLIAELTSLETLQIAGNFLRQENGKALSLHLLRNMPELVDLAIVARREGPSLTSLSEFTNLSWTAPSSGVLACASRELGWFY